METDSSLMPQGSAQKGSIPNALAGIPVNVQVMLGTATLQLSELISL